MSLLCRVLFILLLSVSVETFAVVAASAWAAKSVPDFREEQLSPIAGIVEEAIRDGQIPGAVVLIGTRDRIIYRRAFGYRALAPDKVPMTVDTVFDLASLTKVVATTTAVMQLVEKDLLRLEDPVAKYWPEFKTHGKKYITVRDLLTHYSGLRPDLNLKPGWTGYESALKKILAEKPVSPRGTRFIYSDINFVILGELVRRISGQTLDSYCGRNIFEPLGMKDTMFKPLPELYERIAPTEYLRQSSRMLCGEVHDPTAYRMGGVAGHAGLFSTADDLSIFARMLLHDGSLKDSRILSPPTIEEMTSPHSSPKGKALRGLGWVINSATSSYRSPLFPAGTYGHTGYTGTSIWIDPDTGIYGIILTNRVHPDGKGDARPLRKNISMVIEQAVNRGYVVQALAERVSSGETPEHMDSKGGDAENEVRVQTGIDVLEAEDFATLSGLRVGLITNHSGLDSNGRRTLDILFRERGLKLAAIFSPEHGLSGKVDEKIPSMNDKATGLPVYSLYGDSYRPTDKMLEGLDALVFDVQDAGVRFYTYITTMGYAMEEAAKRGIAFYVLDRPNPLNASMVQGPVMDEDLKSFVGYFPLPIRYGMTIGELAIMFNEEFRIGAKLHVIKMRGYDRSEWYDETGVPWVGPSPNLRNLTQSVLYPGIAMVEGANVSVGRGTDSPFELLGAPWIKAKKLAAYLNKRGIQGVRFKPVSFVPKNDHFKNRECHGIRVILTDRKKLDPTALGIEIASALYMLFKRDFQISKTLALIGSRQVIRSIKEGRNPTSIVRGWQGQLAQFQSLREKYLIY